jgi:hypothetical protein
LPSIVFDNSMASASARTRSALISRKRDLGADCAGGPDVLLPFWAEGRLI